MAQLPAKWTKALASASLRVMDGALSAAEEVERRTLEDGTEVAVYVRVIRTRFAADQVIAAASATTPGTSGLPMGVRAARQGGHESTSR